MLLEKIVFILMGMSDDVKGIGSLKPPLSKPGGVFGTHACFHGLFLTIFSRAKLSYCFRN